MGVRTTIVIYQWFPGGWLLAFSSDGGVWKTTYRYNEITKPQEYNVYE